MAINLRALGSKLTKYRVQLKESIFEVAASTGIDSVRLTAIEAGQAEPTGDEVLILADHYRCDFKFFISNEQVAPFEQTETLYRAHGDDFTKEDRRAVQDFLYLCETEDFLMRELGRPSENFSFAPTGTFFKGHGETAAASLRAALRHSDREVPRDVYAEFRSVGVHVFRRKLGNSNISGLFIMHPVAGKCALVNYSEDIYRQRFSAAHEMAHAIFDSSQGASVSFDGPSGSDMVELRANRFASCFLMPPAVLARLPSPVQWTDADALRWANELRVSCVALAIGLKEAKLIDTASYNRISNLRVPREAKVDPELPDSLNAVQRERKARLLESGLSDHYVGLCFDGFSIGVISVGRLAEALLCSHGELAELATLYGRTLHGH
ncbi:ImmA/IrrE family metallo-endopeptidase [Diaphorobacter sp. HDW4A]|uniref:ImmA/IrrE family metallo-endopeptidase n=1 Tax=Diaphorobacter sp. HDW4A TaxID=2714924 RepID=UPI00140D1045|nr:ImmA/IrrE family metallo-endopeptidase [Diaphorobacter sp. HDW4A]QIL79400.1 ImmA/IrrE family metallo-endopeptidase [Diaphorobacter sp. HDW4A]